MFAFAVLPTIIFVSAFFAILYHIGLMQQIIKVVAWMMQRTMGTSGAESTNVAASIFMGQTEAPLTIRPFLAGATNSELMTIMTSGMAHVSGGIMAAYILFGINAKDLLSAVIMTAPGTILVAKMLVPETEVPATAGTVHMPPNEEHANENFICGHCARDDRRRATGVQRGDHADQLSGAGGLVQCDHAGDLECAVGAWSYPVSALAGQRGLGDARRRRWRG